VIDELEDFPRLEAEAAIQAAPETALARQIALEVPK
jgi:hypothetical protein